MNEKSLDRRPKILSYRNTLDGLNIAARDGILWPCHAFNFSLPYRKGRRLNIFEETVFKLTACETSETDKIAQLMGIEKELALFIQSKLRHFGLLDHRHILTEDGEKLIAAWDATETDNYVVATIFLDLLSGQLLPFITIDPLSFKQVQTTNAQGRVGFQLHVTSERPIYAQQIFPTRDAYWNKTPEPREIIKCIKEFKRRFKRYVMLNPDLKEDLPSIPNAEAISITSKPDLVFLHCEALIQRGNDDLLVTDGFGFGFSEIFSDYISSKDWEWINKLKQKGVEEYLRTEGSSSPDSSACTPPNLKRYPKIQSALLKATQSVSNSLETKIVSTNSENETYQQVAKALVSLYEAIEWTLRLIVSEYSAGYWDELLTSQSHRDNGNVLSALATKIGFNISKKEIRALEVAPGKIKRALLGDTEMQPLLALGLASASGNDRHPFYTLAKEDPDSLCFIFALKEARDPASHGNTLDLNLNAQHLPSYLDRTSRIIQLLLPDISIDFAGQESVIQRDQNQLHLVSRLELERKIGHGFVNSLSPTLREELIKMLMLSAEDSSDPDDIKRMVIALAATLQLTFFEITKNLTPVSELKSDIKQSALQAIVTAGYCPQINAIPKEISTVNPVRLERAYRGLSVTLGANLLSLFLLADHADLKALRDKAPQLIDFTSEVIKKRGHGNGHDQSISRADVLVLQDKLLNLIKLTMDTF